ncbi:hypothetical protein BDZ89DRAFT_1252330 [Hymenopellis radicata]|nr:hypothetical protein BDZ89DRAFT_1252330 [Hymenopellis radicata]
MMLSKMTQSKAYKAIREIKMSTEKYKEALERTNTARNLSNAIACGAEEEDDEPTEDVIWKSLRIKDFSRSARYFLWMTMHEGYKVGKYWLMTQNNQDRAICTRCGVTESMEHILFECEFPGQKEIWEIASEVWKNKTGEELNVTFGTVVEGVTKRGRSRLRRILISELAHLIWKIRNARVCDGGNPATIPELDIMMSDKRKYGSKAINKALVLSTWSGTLKDEGRLPEDWIREKGVLVGVT